MDLINDPEWIDFKIDHLLEPFSERSKIILFGFKKPQEYYEEKCKEVLNASVDWETFKELIK